MTYKGHEGLSYARAMPNLSNIGGGRHYAVATIRPDPDAHCGRVCRKRMESEFPSGLRRSPGHLRIVPGGATATLGLRIYMSDVVVRARFVSGGDGKFSFRAIEYLKGSGSSDFEVIDERAGGNPKWSLHEAVLLLSMPEEDEETLDPGDATTFIFTDTVAQNYEEYGMYGFPRFPYGYSIETRNPVWLPAVERAVDSSTPDDDLRFYTDAGVSHRNSAPLGVFGRGPFDDCVAGDERGHRGIRRMCWCEFVVRAAVTRSRRNVENDGP